MYANIYSRKFEKFFILKSIGNGVSKNIHLFTCIHACMRLYVLGYGLGSG